MKLDGLSFKEVYLQTEEGEFDLHNCFDFVGLNYKPFDQTLSMRWEPNRYASKLQQQALKIEWQGVIHFSVTAREPGFPASEDTCLNCVGFIPADAPMFQSSEPDPATDRHCVLTFTSGLRIRIGAHSASCHIDSDLLMSSAKREHAIRECCDE